MKTIKPIRLAILNRPYSDGERDFLAITGIALMPFANPTQLVSEPSLWKFVAEQLGKDAVLDAGMPKLSAEFLLTGKCYSPTGLPVPAMAVKARVGAIQKTLAVLGDRQWLKVKKSWRMSDPLPFTEIDVAYANAFGGADFLFNPIGKGMPPAEKDSCYPLPNIFNETVPVVSVNDRPEPAGFAPLDFLWPQRFGKAGTYDEQWRKTRFPGFAADMDWRIFSAAQPDQWLPGFLTGDERIEISGMHSQHSNQACELPGFAARCFITEKISEKSEFREVPMRAETLWLFPNASHMVLIYRGVTAIVSDDASSVLHLVAGLEFAGEPKSEQHYRTVLEQRLDKRKGAAYALDDSPLLPAGLKDVAPVPAVAEIDAMTQSRGHMEDNQRRKAAKDLLRGQQEAAAQRKQLLEIARINHQPPPDLSGLDKFIAQTLPPKVPNPRAEQLPQILDEVEREASLARATALAQKAAMEKTLRELCAQQGLDFDKLPKASAPPRFKAAQLLEQITSLIANNKAAGFVNPELERLISDPQLPHRLEQAAHASLQSYRLSAQHFSPSEAGEHSLSLRAQVMNGFARGESFAGQDLTGADLSGLDLSNADFSDALMESVNLKSARLAGAKLTGALLAHARLDGACLEHANLEGANLGKAGLAGVCARGANLTRAVLDEADLSGADFSEAMLDGAKLGSAKLCGAKFIGASAVGLHLIDTFNIKPDTALEDQAGLDLRSTDFSKADLKTALFLNSQLEGTCLQGANLESATFVGVTATDANFSGAHLAGLRVVHGSRLEGALFKDADLSRANFRGIAMDRADLNGARLEDADFSGASLRQAQLKDVRAKGLRATSADFSDARMNGANLHAAVLQKAQLSGADLSQANLFMADLLKVRHGEFTLLEGASLGKTLLEGKS